MSTKEATSANLNVLQAKGVIDYWQLQHNMPGLRWSLCINGKATIAFSSAEVGAFVTGAFAGLNAATAAVAMTEAPA